jgi:hypothetical protein
MPHHHTHATVTDAPLCADEMPPPIQTVLRHACGRGLNKWIIDHNEGYCLRHADPQNPCGCHDFMPSRVGASAQFSGWWQTLNSGTHSKTARVRQISRLVRKLQPIGGKAPLVLFGFNSGCVVLRAEPRCRIIGGAPSTFRISRPPASFRLLAASACGRYAYLFENWARGVAANGIEMRDRTLVISDDASRGVVEAAGYTMPEEHVYGLDTLCSGGSASGRSARASRWKCEQPASSFALWPHQGWMAAWIVAAHDLVLLGHDVLMLDVDIVWQRDPVPWLLEAHPYMPCAKAPHRIWQGHRPFEPDLQTWGHRWQCPVSEGVAEPTQPDLQLMEDGRTDVAGPGNGGLLFIRSNCRTRRFMRAWFSGIPAMVNQRSGQLLINSLLMSESLNVSVGMLPPRLFLNGPHFVGRGYLLARSAARFPRDWMVAHASWTSSHLEKLGCFYLLGAAFLPAHRWPNGTDVWVGNMKKVLHDAHRMNRTRPPPDIGQLRWNMGCSDEATCRKHASATRRSAALKERSSSGRVRGVPVMRHAHRVSSAQNRTRHVRGAVTQLDRLLQTKQRQARHTKKSQ